MSSQMLIANQVLATNEVGGVKAGNESIENVENCQKLENCLSLKIHVLQTP